MIEKQRDEIYIFLCFSKNKKLYKINLTEYLK